MTQITADTPEEKLIASVLLRAIKDIDFPGIKIEDLEDAIYFLLDMRVSRWGIAASDMATIVNISSESWHEFLAPLLVAGCRRLTKMKQEAIQLGIEFNTHQPIPEDLTNEKR